MWRDPFGRRIGSGEPVYVIAEIGLNHGGSLEKALAMVEAAADAGASAVKLQSLRATELVAPACPAPAHVETASLQDFFARFELDEAAHAAIAARAHARGMAVLTTPFSTRLLPMLERVGIDAYKVASGDLTHDELLLALARTGRPVILSTGMGTLAEVTHAVGLIRGAGGSVAAVLHCVSAYPTPAEAQNLRALVTLADAVDAPVGLSDHSADGTMAAILGVALGATVYERHLKLEGDTEAIDAPVSSTPGELATIVAACADAGRRLGTGRKVCQPAESVNRTASRRGLYARRDLPAGRILGPDDLIALRPETDLPAADLSRLLGQRLTAAVAAGEALTLAALTRRAA